MFCHFLSWLAYAFVYGRGVLAKHAGENISFPAIEFFTQHNLSVSAHNFSSFLCHVNPKELKCCSCYKTCYEDCCIDVWWERNRHQQLDQYLEEIAGKYEEDATKKGTSCLPMYPSLNYKSGHSHIIDSYHDSEGRFVYCKRNSKINVHELPVVGQFPNLYMNEHCAKSNGVNEISQLNYSVQCKYGSNLTDGMPFLIATNRVEKCIFTIKVNKWDRYLWPGLCPGDRADCDTNNANYRLCKFYTAPIKGYKNQHCYKCKHRNVNIKSTEYTPCNKERCYKGVCSLDDVLMQYSVKFVLITTKANHPYISQIQYVFPYTEFLGFSENEYENAYNIMEHLCLGDNNDLRGRRCCDCTDACVKFKSCCMDKFWNASNPISMDAYKKVLVEKGRTDKTHACLRLFPSATLEENPMFLMIATCPQNATVDEKAKCASRHGSSLLSIIPVIGEDNYLYSNTYCASCHSVKNYKPVNITVSWCDLHDPNMDMRTNCVFDISNVDVMQHKIIRACVDQSGWKRKCLPGNKFYDLCNSYRAPIGKLANHHCDLCQASSVQRKMDHSRHSSCRPWRDILAWSMMISFSKDMHIRNPKSWQGITYSICNNSDIFNLNKKECNKTTTIWVEHIRQADLYISFIGSSMSVVAYLLIIITYCIFVKFHNLPGKCTLALSSSLFIGDSMFLIGGISNLTGLNESIGFCKVVAIIMHFGLILAHLWGTIISYDLMKRFSKLTNTGDIEIFWPYVLITVTISFIIVLTSITLDHLAIIVIGYGDNGTCAPHKFYGRLYFYVIPVIISFTFSLIFLVKTIHKIAIENRENRNALQHSGREDLKVALIALKCILVLGVSEGVGFMQIKKASLTESETMFNMSVGLLYSLLRSTRGIALVIVYICKAEVVALYHSKLQRLSRPSFEDLSRSDGTIGTNIELQTSNFNRTKECAGPNVK